VPGHILQAKYHWDRGEFATAQSQIDAALADGDLEKSVCWTKNDLKRQSRLPFETAIANLLLEDGALILSFADAFTRIWASLPAQYLILILTQIHLDPVSDRSIASCLIESAQQGLLSFRRDDYDYTGKVVIDPEKQGDLVNFIGEDQVKKLIDAPDKDANWKQWLGRNETVALDVFFYLVFHREPKSRPAMIQARLDRVGESGAELCELVLDILPKEIACGRDLRSLVHIGLRIEAQHDAQTCLLELEDSLRRRSFEPFVRRYFGGP
jgi:hypothetical protein